MGLELLKTNLRDTENVIASNLWKTGNTIGADIVGVLLAGQMGWEI